MEIKELLYSLTPDPASSGQERPLAEKAAALFAPWCRTRVDQNGNLIASLSAAGHNGRHLLLDAHLDEIGLVVTGITEEGFVRVAQVGGVDRRMLLSSEVMLLGRKPLFGVVCAAPPHLLSPEDRKKPPKIEDCYLDLGYSKEQLEPLLALGDPGVFIGEPVQLLGGKVCSKALDNRAGCAVLALAARMLGEDPPDCQVSFVLSAKEEVNGAGAKTSAFSLNPTHAIVVDVTFADAPGMPEQPGRAKLGDGPVVSFAPVLDRDTSRALLELAQKENIPALSEADGGRTSTNADDIAVSREGVVTGVVSVPLRYMHSPVEVCLEEDIQAAARLLFHYAHSL